MVDKQAGAKTAKTSNDVAGRLNVKAAANAAAHDASSKAHGPVTRVEVGPDGIVALPAGVTPDQIHVQGKDLVVNLADGSQIIIVNGAQNVPTLEMGNVELPGQNVIALLNIEGQPGVQPAAGPAGSSGGNFSTPPGAIDPGFGIDPLLPPTELQFGPIAIRELQQGLLQNGPPTVTVPPSPATPGAPPPGGIFAPGTQVFEAGLPAHAGLPAGSAAGNGSNVTAGTVTYTAPAGLAAITFNGQTVVQGLTITTSMGAFTVNSVNLATGVITYTYTLNTNTSGPNTGDVFNVVVTDVVGQSASGTFTVSIVDDVPTARADIGSLAAGQYGPLTGNVETSNDTQGADGSHVSGVHGAGTTAFTTVPAGAAGVVVHGQYGDLTIHQDGSYSYVRSGTSAGGVSDVFNYQLTDGDGSTSTTTLTINIGNAAPTVTVTPNGPTDSASHGVVNEAALPAGSHSGGSATTTGVISYTPGDNPDTITVGGVNATVGAVVHGTHGDLTITAVDTTNHTVTYAYTLTSPVTGAAGNDGANNEGAGDTFAVVVTDVDGSSASTSVVIDVIDDVPTAIADTNAVPAGSYAAVTGNVETNDIPGADGASVLGAKAAASAGFTAVASDAAGTTISGQYGDLTIHQDGTYSYARHAGSPGGVSDVFNYQLTDKDGDTSATTLTINIGNGTPTITVTPGGPTDDAGHSLVNEAGLAAGSHGNDGSATVTGVLSYTPGDAPDSVTIGGVNAAVGAVVHGAHGDLTITAVDAANHTVSYSYTLSSPLSVSGAGTNNEGAGDTFAVTVTDVDGSSATSAVTVDVLDDVPTAVLDTNVVPAGSYAAVTGNVESNDTQGADGAAVTAVSGAMQQQEGEQPSPGFTPVPPGAAGVTVHGQYGDLTIHQDGSYSYARHDGTPGGVSDVFNYQLTDADGDVSTTTLTISIGNDTPTVTVTPGGPTDAAGNSLVNEAGLAAGSHADDGSATVTGVLSYTPGDGPDSVTIGGVNATVGAVVHGAHGDLTVTAVDAANHTVSYSYTLSSPLSVSGAGTNNEGAGDTFAVVVTDLDGSQATSAVTVDVLDDVPTAALDTNAVPAGSYAAVGGNVESNDTQGADTAAVLGVKAAASAGFTAVDAGLAGTTISGQYGDLTIHQDGTYSYVRNAGTPGGVSDVFNYQLTDKDGDVSATTLTISIGNDTPTVTVTPGGPTDAAGNSTVNEAGLPAGSHTGGSATTTGVIGYTPGDGPDTITIGGVNATVGALVHGTHGDLTVTAVDTVNHTINYSYTLTSPLSVSGAGTNNEGAGDTFAVVVTDLDGSQATSSAVIDVIDDLPSAHNDANVVNVGEYGPVTGNVIAGTGVDSDGNAVTPSVADVLGADGAVVSSAQSINLAASAATVTSAGTLIHGQYGDLTIHQDGSYSYLRNQNSGHGVDKFNYTLTDGDGDTTTAELDITIADKLPGVTPPHADPTNPALSDANTLVHESGIAGVGSSAGDGSATVTGTFHFTPGDDPNVVTVGGVTLTTAHQAVAGTHGGLTVWLDSADPTLIHYSYTLTSAVNGPGAGMNYEGVVETFTVTVTDADGASEKATGTLSIGVYDDVPSVTVATTSDTGVVLLTHDALTIAAASDAATSTGNFGGVFSETHVAGADGAGAVTWGYALNVTTQGEDSGLQAGASGAAIHLYKMADGSVVGSTSATAPASIDGTVVFSVSVNNVGVVTLTQYSEIHHAAGSDLATLGNGLLTLTGTASITDNDGDVATNAKTVDLGGNIQFADDHPTITVSVAADAGVVLTTHDALTIAAASDVATSTGNFGGIFTESDNPHADAPDSAAAWTFALNLTSQGEDSGLKGGASGATIHLYKLADGTVVGSTAASAPASIDGTVVFSVSVNNAGVVTLTQYSEIHHAAGSDLATLGNGLLSLVGTASVTDADGDTATDSKSVDLGGNIAFADDHPTITVSVTSDTAVVLTTHDALTIGAASDAATSTASFGGVFHETDTTGADAPNSAAAWTYALNLTTAGEDSGLKAGASGATIHLYKLADGTVVGSTAASAPASIDATVVFSVSVNSSGVVTLTQYSEIHHAAGSDLATLGNGLLNLVGTASVTDADGDTATDSKSVDLGGNISFVDDHPTITVSVTSDAAVVLTTHDALTIGAASDAATSTASFGGVFHETDSSGADAPSSVAWTYALSLTTAGEDSGLTAGASGMAIHLYQLANGTVVGSTSLTAPTSIDATVVFSVAVNSSGVVTLTQYSEIHHAAGSDLAALGNGLLNLVGTASVTDADGDTATDSKSVDLGGNISFADDHPTITVSVGADTGVVLTTHDALTIGAASDAASSTASFGGVFGETHTTGADAPVSTTAWNYALNLTTAGEDSGLKAGASGASIFLYKLANGTVVGSTSATAPTSIDASVVFSLAVNSAGAVTLTQYSEIHHAVGSDLATLGNGLLSLTGTASVTDADGDTATDSKSVDLGGNIAFADDKPTIGPIDNGAHSNNPADPAITGNLHLVTGADAPASIVSIGDVGDHYTAGGGAVVYANGQDAAFVSSHAGAISVASNILIGYVDTNHDGYYSTGDLEVLSVTESTSGTGSYNFQLFHSLDGQLVTNSVTGSNSFGSGPTGFQELTAGSTTAVLLAGFSGGVNATSLDLSHATQGGVNGSTTGWGIDSNNFNVGDAFVLDFHTTNTSGFPSGYTPPTPFTTPITDTVTVAFPQFNVGDTIKYIAYYGDPNDGTGTANSGVITHVLTAADIAAFTISAPVGDSLDYVEIYDVSGKGKFQVVSTGTIENVANDTLHLTTTVSDADGDTATGAYNVTVSGAAAPIVLDLTHDGVQFVGTEGGNTFDYGAGQVATAWAAPGDGVLAWNTVNGPVVTFSGFVSGATTDIQGLTAFDTNHDGKLDAGDAEWSNFGVLVNGHFESLANAHVASIDLSTNGQPYSAANGQVQVTGTGAFTYADGTSGQFADASFQTAPVSKPSSTTPSTTTNDNAYNDSLAAAAGIVAAAVVANQQPVADAPPAAGPTTPTPTTTTVAHTDDTSSTAAATPAPTVELVTTQTSTQPATSDASHASSTDTSVQSLSVDGGHAGVQGAAPAPLHTAVAHAASDGQAHGLSLAQTKVAFLDGSSLPTFKGHGDHHAVQPSANGANNAPAGAPAPQGQGEQTAEANTGKVAAVVADALHGGAQGGPDLNQLIDTLKGGQQQAQANDNGGQSGAVQGPAHAGLAYLDLHTGASESVNAALQQHHHPMVAHDMVSGAHHA
jgi:VCBS repeat-containing protein